MVWVIGAVIVTVVALVLGWLWYVATEEHDPVVGMLAVILSVLVFVVLSGIVGQWAAPYVKAHL